MSDPIIKRVLSIQSHVVSGYVGNKAAVFPMQLLGWDVDSINSVQFSNHTGYPTFQGDRLSKQQFDALQRGLEQNQLLKQIQYLLTGYMGSETVLMAVLDLWKQWKQSNPNAQYVCDPVLGDHGRFYVPQSLVQVYQTHILPHATIVTPNQFELEQLTGRTTPITTLLEAQQQCAILHDMGPSLVFLTSLQCCCIHDTKMMTTTTTSLTTNDPEQMEGKDDKVMTILASQRITKTIESSHQHHHDADDPTTTTMCWKIECPIIPGSFTGTGDLCAALILVHAAETSNNVPVVLEKVVNTIYAVLERTVEHMGDTIQSKELRLIQSKDLIENPPQRFRAERLM